MPSLCEKPCATSRALYLIISFFSLHFHTNTHLYLPGTTPLGVWTTSPNTSRFSSEFNFA